MTLAATSQTLPRILRMEDANENLNDTDDAVILAVYSEDDPYLLF